MEVTEPQPGELVTHIGFELEFGPVLMEIVRWTNTVARIRVVTCFKPMPDHIEIGQDYNVDPAALRRPNPLELLALAAL